MRAALLTHGAARRSAAAAVAEVGAATRDSSRRREKDQPSSGLGPLPVDVLLRDLQLAAPAAAARGGRVACRLLAH